MSVQEMDKSDLTISLKDKLSEGLREFSEKIIDLNFGFPLAMGWASLSSILHSTETLSFIEEFGNVNGKEFTLPLECVNQFSKLSRRDSAADMYFKRMPGFYLTALVEELDLYIGNLVGILLDHEGFEQRLSDKHISYKEMLSFSSFEKARESLIDKEIDNVLRQGIASQIDWFNGAGYKLPIDHSIIKQQIEIGERRNCIVHADGKANSTYIEKCDKHEISISPKKEGDSLKPDGKYCNQSFEATLIFGCMLFSASWIKLCKKEDKKWDGMIGVLNEIVYDLMKDERWDVSRNLLKFIFEDLKLDLGEINRRMLKINFALSQKEAEGKQDFEKILDSEDWNASSLDFQAAVACIRGDNKTALVLIKNGFKAQQIDKAALVDWPVFNRIRSLKSFKKLYIDLVGEKEAEKVSMEPVERHHFGPGMKLILDQAISQIERTDLKRLSEAADKQKSTAVVHHGKGEDVDVPFG